MREGTEHRVRQAGVALAKTVTRRDARDAAHGSADLDGGDDVRCPRVAGIERRTVAQSIDQVWP
jgi:hypothetical protein